LLNGPSMILDRAPVEIGARLQSLCKALVDKPPTKFPNGVPMESDVCPLSPPPYVLLDPQKGTPPNRAPAKREAPFPESSNYLLKSPVTGLPSFPNRPLQGETPISRAYFYTFLSKSPVNAPPSMFPNRVPMEREASSPEPVVYSFIYICQSLPEGIVIFQCSCRLCCSLLSPLKKSVSTW
jgi:hypothetical protein